MNQFLQLLVYTVLNKVSLPKVPCTMFVCRLDLPNLTAKMLLVVVLDVETSFPLCPFG